MKVKIEKEDTADTDAGSKEWPLFIDVEPEQTTLDLKKEIEVRKGIKDLGQRLYHASSEIESILLIEMEDELILDEYFKDEDEISLVLILEKRKHRKVTIEIQNLDIPIGIQCLFPDLLKKMPCVAKPNLFSKDPVTIDTKKEAAENALRLRVMMNKQKRKGEVETEDWIKIFLDQFRLTILKIGNTGSDSADLRSKFGKIEIPTISQEQIKNLVSPLNERDKISFEIEENGERFLPAGIPLLFPCFERKLANIDTEVNKKIVKLFKNNIGELIKNSPDKTEIVLDMAFNLDGIDVDDLHQLQKDMNKDTTYPFLPILKIYKDRGGTFGGLTKFLDKCLKDESITNRLGSLAEQKLNDLLLYITDVAWEEFQKWISKYIPNKQKAHMDDYKDFLHKSESGWRPKDILEGNTRSLEEVKEDAEEGDQIWMWRKGCGDFQYAHVGIFLGSSLVHVSRKGLSAVIKEEALEDVVGDSECYLVKSPPKAKIKGTFKERAKACVGIEFSYSVTSGNCETFANAITNGIFTTEKSTLQGAEFSFTNKMMKSLYVLTKGKTYKKQDEDLLNKVAKRLAEKGFHDQDIVAHSRALHNKDN